MRAALMSTTRTSMSGAFSAIMAIVGPPTYPAPMQQIFIGIRRRCWGIPAQIQAVKEAALRPREGSGGRRRRGRAAGPQALAGGRLVGNLLVLGLVGRLADEGRGDRRADLAELQDLQDMPPLERLMLEERLRDLVERRPALADDRLRALVLLRNDAVDLDVDPVRRLLGHALGAGYVAPEEHRVVVVPVCDRPERAHAPVAHHVARDDGDLLDVARRAARDVPEDELLGDAPPEPHGDLVEHPLH